MTTYEALSLLVQFSISITAGLTLIVTIIVFLKKEVTALSKVVTSFLTKHRIVNRSFRGYSCGTQ